MRLRWMAALPLMMTAGPALAENWMLVGATGAKPARVHYYAAFDLIDQRYDSEAEGGDAAMMANAVKARDMGKYLDARAIRRLRVIQVNEAAALPDTVEYRVDIKCAARQFRIFDATAWARDSRSTKLGGLGWAPIGSGWVEGVRRIACDTKAFQKAVAAAQKSGKPDALSKLGLVYAGQALIGTELADATWTMFWADGQRPPYSSPYSPAETERRRKQAMADFAKAATEWEAKAGDIKTDLEMQDKMDRAMRSAGAKWAMEMQGTAGWSEAKVIARWGPPQGVSESGGVRRLDYYFQDTVYDLVQERMDVLQCQGGGCAKVGETGGATTTQARTVNCQRTLFLKQGGSEPGYRLYDFSINCG